MNVLPPHLLAAAAGGALGASLRYVFVSLVLPGAWGILALNVAGSLALGLLLGWQGRPEWLSVFAGAGFLGALTTFSTFSGDIVRIVQNNFAAAALYLLASVILGVVAFLLGNLLARSLL